MPHSVRSISVDNDKFVKLARSIPNALLLTEINEILSQLLASAHNIIAKIDYKYLARGWGADVSVGVFYFALAYSIP